MLQSKRQEVLTVNAKKYTAQDIADWFVIYNQKFVETEEAELITPMKLQKLLYYAQAAFLALKDVSLFDDEIEKWPHGPVVRSVYQKYSFLGANGIDPLRTSHGEEKISNADERLLEAVYEKYSQFSASALRNKTHLEAPWRDAGRHEIISKDSIKKYYKENVYNDEKIFANIPVVNALPKEWYDAEEDALWEAYL
jgi:uncharacterized phage-associated protein